MIDLLEFDEEEGTRYLQRILPYQRFFWRHFGFTRSNLQHRVIEMKREFVANASHELRTPITIIRGFAETLEDPDLLSKEQIHLIVDKITRNCERMTTLIEELLLLSDIENLPEERIEESDLLYLLQKCKDLIREAWPEANIQIQTHGLTEIYVYGIPNLLERALFNLMENGVDI